MPRLFFVPATAVVAVLASVPEARADVVVSERADAPSRVIVKTGPPTVVVVTPGTAAVPPPSTPPVHRDRERKVGIHFDVGGTFGRDITMGGFSGALRFRPAPHFALDLGAGYFAGDDFDGDFRTEIPVTANMLFFVNPKSKVQFYVLLGPAVSFARKEMITEVRRMTYVGGQGGAGLEFRLAPAFALNVDVRGFVRHRVDPDPRPEFVDAGRTTDTSAGALATFGATFYF